MNHLAAESGDIKVCSISLNMTDRIRLIGVPTALTSAIQEAIMNGWGPIQDERPYHGTHEFKVKGNPWLGNGPEAVMARRLVNSILIAMARNGWNLIQSADCSKKQGDKDTLFFENAQPDPDAMIFVITFNMGDRIRVIDSPQMMAHVRQAVDSRWPGGIQSEKEYHGSLELKLSGNPWYAQGSDAVHSRMVLNQILANCRALGFKLYGSVDVSAGAEGQDLDSWYFRKLGNAWP